VYLYFDPGLQHAGSFDDASLAATTERHHVEFKPPPLNPVADAQAELSRSAGDGVVFELASGLPSHRHLELIERTLGAGRRAWLFWPEEQAVECVDAERLDSLRQHVRRVTWLERVGMPIDNLATRWNRAPTGLRWIYRGEFPVRRSDILIKLTLLTLRAQPVPLSSLCGAAMYLRSDYWNAGPDDEPMSRVVASLAAASGRIVCLTPRSDAGVELTGAQQVVMDPPRQHEGEDAIVLAPTHYWPIVKAACQTLPPAYLYDRGTAAQSVGAELSQLLGIPYVLEYRGAGAIVREALGGATPFYPELYAQAEELALRQATAIVVAAAPLKDELAARGIDASRVIVASCPAGVGALLAAYAEEQRIRDVRAASIDTGDSYKDQVQYQWNQNPVGSQHARTSQPHTLDWFLEVERHRYDVYAPWMREAMEFDKHAGHDVLEIGGGIGTDLAQFAAHGARVTDIDLAAGHLELAQENFRLRGLQGRFIHHDAESLPFDDASFDLVYSNGVLHHTPNTATVVAEIRRVLRPGGRAIVMLYAEHSLHYWRKQVWLFGVKGRMLERMSMAAIMSRMVERSANDARPLVKVYTKRRAAALFRNFERVEILQKQLVAEELPDALKWTLRYSEARLGWNLIVKAAKPAGAMS
jgi:ubiquinone/menaquinone biosynthesis C-methylase UbiE